VSYIVRSHQNPVMILTTIGEYKPASMVGPGGYCARVYKTRARAQVAADRHGGAVEAFGERQ